MKLAASSILLALCTFLSACTTTVQVGGAFQAGRRALIGGDDEAALGFLLANLLAFLTAVMSVAHNI